MNVGEITIQFAAVPDGTRWQVLIKRQTTTLDVVTVDHDELGVPHDPDSLDALSAAIEKRARELLAEGHARRTYAPTEEISVIDWSPEGSASAREALEALSGRFTAQQPHDES